MASRANPHQHNRTIPVFAKRARWLLTAPGAPFACGILAPGSRSATVQARRNWLISRGHSRVFSRWPVRGHGRWRRASPRPSASLAIAKPREGFPGHQIEGERPGSIAFSRTANTSSSEAERQTHRFLISQPGKSGHPDGTTRRGPPALPLPPRDKTLLRAVQTGPSTSGRNIVRASCSISGPCRRCWCVAISPDGRTAVSGSAEGRPWRPLATTKVWRLTDPHSDPCWKTLTGWPGRCREGAEWLLSQQWLACLDA